MRTRTRSAFASVGLRFAMIPSEWVLRAARRPRNASVLLVGHYLWHLAGCAGRRESLQPRWEEAQFEVGVGRRQFFAALQVLEARQLIRVTQRPRWGAVISLPSDAELATWQDPSEPFL